MKGLTFEYFTGWREQQEKDPGLVVRALDSQSRGSRFKTSRWVQGQFSLPSFKRVSDDYFK